MTWWNYIENYPNLPGKLVLRPLLGKRNQGHHAQMALGCPLIEVCYTNGNYNLVPTFHQRVSFETMRNAAGGL